MDDLKPNLNVNVNWKSKSIQKFASREENIVCIICVLFNLIAIIDVDNQKTKFTWQSVQQHLENWSQVLSRAEIIDQLSASYLLNVKFQYLQLNILS